MDNHKKIIDKLSEFESITLNDINGICGALGENTFNVLTYLTENGYLAELENDTFVLTLSQSESANRNSSVKTAGRNAPERGSMARGDGGRVTAGLRDGGKSNQAKDNSDTSEHAGKPIGIYDIIVAALAKHKMKYKYLKAKQGFYLANIGEDLPIPLFIIIDEQRKSLKFISDLPFRFTNEKAADGVFASCAINEHVLYGTFDYDLNSGTPSYKYALPYDALDEDTFAFLLFSILNIIDLYNDKLYDVSEGKLTVTDLLAMLNDNTD